MCNGEQLHNHVIVRCHFVSIGQWSWRRRGGRWKRSRTGLGGEHE